MPILAAVATNYLNRLYLRARQCTTSSCFAWLWQQDRGKVARNPRFLDFHSRSCKFCLQKCTIRFVFVNCEKWNKKNSQAIFFCLFTFTLKHWTQFSWALFIKYNLQGGLRSARTESIVCKWTYRNNWLKIAKPF